mgnify:CR=1 FL=1
MKMKHTRKILCLSLSLLSSSVYAELPAIKEGRWHVEANVMMGSVAMPIPKSSIDECFTKSRMRPENILRQDKCVMQNMSLKKHRARWSMACEYMGMKMQGIGDIAFQEKSFSGDFNMTVSNSPMGGVALQTKITGRYIGACS